MRLSEVANEMQHELKITAMKIQLCLIAIIGTISIILGGIKENFTIYFFIIPSLFPFSLMGFGIIYDFLSRNISARFFYLESKTD